MVVLTTFQTAVAVRSSELLFDYLASHRIFKQAEIRNSNVDMGFMGLKPG
jgi:hypothetical protein